MISEITSRTNPRVKDLASRVKELFVFEGEKLVMDLVARGEEIELLLVHERLRDRVQDARAADVWVTRRGVLDKISRLKDAPDLIAVLPSPERPLPLETARAVVVLDGLQDPANAGTVFRCAAAFGIDGIILTGDGVKPWNHRFIRAAQTAVLDVPWRLEKSLEGLLALPGIAGFNVYMTAAAPEGEAKCMEIEHPCLVVVGNEGHGIAKPFLQEYPVLSIPQSGRVESLNAGVSACILMYEMQRLRQAAAGEEA